jgi:hypothetical protein
MPQHDRPPCCARPDSFLHQLRNGGEPLGRAISDQPEASRTFGCRVFPEGIV